MPMDFPDMESLVQCAEIWKFRAPLAGEPERAYRHALADHVAPQDFIESQEIRNGRGWDKWDDLEQFDMLARAFAQKRTRVNP